MRRSLAAFAAAAVPLLAACGGGEAAGGDRRVTVFAASSLTEVFQGLGPQARFNFAGSNELATQVREGAPADVYAAASARYPDELHQEGLVEEPRVFATSRLVAVVPADNPAGIRSVGDLAGDGTRVVVGAEGVPVGDYTREVLAEGGLAGILDRVVSNEADVKGVLAKVAAGDADAGFVYATDARAAAGAVRTIELPDGLGADVVYPIAVVAETPNRAAAEAFVALVLGEEGRRALREAGFGIP